MEKGKEFNLSPLDSRKESGVTVSIILDKRRSYDVAKGRKGEPYFPIKLRVYNEGNTNYIDIGEKSQFANYDALHNISSRSDSVKQQRNRLIKALDKAIETIKMLVINNEYNFPALESAFKADSALISVDMNLSSLLLRKSQQCRKEQRYNTALTYECAAIAVRRYRGDKVSLKSINVPWLKGFALHLQDSKRSNATIAIYMKEIRCILNESIRAGKLNAETFPFGIGKYEIPSTASRDMALTKEQLRMIRDYRDGNNVTEMYRDLWLFSYFACGMNIGDMFRMKYSNIQGGEISFLRHKTANKTKFANMIHIPISDEMKEIIKKWGNEFDADNYVFPFLNECGNEEDRTKRIRIVNAMMNEKLRKIGKDLGFGKISTYTARHSFASIAMGEGASLGYISQALGHTNIATTSAYLDQFNKEVRIKEHNKLKL